MSDRRVKYSNEAVAALKKIQNEGKPAFTSDQIGMLVQGTAPLHLMSEADKCLKNYDAYMAMPMSRREVEQAMEQLGKLAMTNGESIIKVTQALNEISKRLMIVARRVDALEISLMKAKIIEGDPMHWYESCEALSAELRELIDAANRQ